MELHTIHTLITTLAGPTKELIVYAPQNFILRVTQQDKLLFNVLNINNLFISRLLFDFRKRNWITNYMILLMLLFMSYQTLTQWLIYYPFYLHYRRPPLYYFCRVVVVVVPILLLLLFLLLLVVVVVHS
jgi:hypothetical protein